MAPSSCIPPLLQPCVQLPSDDSLLVLTSTLGASANWLLLRFLGHALSTTTGQEGGRGEEKEEEEGYNVVLVSWMREHDFWKQEARKGTGLDLERLAKEARFAFVDALGGDAHPRAQPQPSQRGPQTLPARGPAGRTVPTPSPGPATPGHYPLTTLHVADVKATISRAISALATTAAQRKTLLILDNPDVLLALNPSITPSSLTSLILTLHATPTVSHVLTHIHADHALLSLSTPPQPLELAHHNLLVKCAHMSRRTIGLRRLDTGVARDVSGVIRITEQKNEWLHLGLDGDEAKHGDTSGSGKEFLYQVKGDGTVKVFERGAGGEA